MQRDSALAVVLALLALLALGTAAATLTDTSGSPGSVGAGTGQGSGSGGSDDGQVGDDDTAGISRRPVARGAFGIGICVEWAQSPLVTALAFLGLLALAVWVQRKSGSVAFGLVTVLGFLGPLILIRALLTAGCGSPGPMEAVNRSVGNISVLPPMSGGSGGGGGAETVASAPSMALGLVLVVALVVAVVLLFSATGDDEATPAGEPEPAVDPEDPDVAAVGRAAGRAADRIETAADVENEVFRAWREMTAHLDVDRPESSTPAEFADAAVAAGMDADDVRELTALFEAVRYGEVPVTAERERRAVAALRRIESSYADEGKR